MRRGDVVTVAAAGDYGKPRAVIVQTDAFPATHASVVVCQLTSDCSDAPDFRVTVDPTARNGLRVKSQVMADKPVTIRRERVGRRIGHLDRLANAQDFDSVDPMDSPFDQNRRTVKCFSLCEPRGSRVATSRAPNAALLVDWRFCRIAESATRRASVVPAR
jgi:mRNA interferase MazF